MLFDGVCHVCSGAVRFIIARDRRSCFAFAPLQSGVARGLLADAGLGESVPDSLVLIEDGRAYVRSTAILRIARRLRFPWPAAWILIVLPRPLRDWAYDQFARRRYRWFGRSETCMVPPPQWHARFLSTAADSRPAAPDTDAACQGQGPPDQENAQ